jgi:hypothetical protein
MDFAHKIIDVASSSHRAVEKHYGHNGLHCKFGYWSKKAIVLNTRAEGELRKLYIRISIFLLAFCGPHLENQ